MSKLWQEEAQDEEMMIMEMERDMENAEYKYLDEKKQHLHTFKGQPLYGTSTIVGILNKPLTWWAAGMALTELGWTNPKLVSKEEGIKIAGKARRFMFINNEEYYAWLQECYRAHDSKKKEAAVGGTDMHAELEKYVKDCITKNQGNPDWRSQPDVTEHHAVKSFRNWACLNIEQFLFTEGHTYSEKYWVGGIVDTGAKMKDGRTVLLDFKSSKEPYYSQMVQVAGYALQVAEKGILTRSGQSVLPPMKIDEIVVVAFGSDDIKTRAAQNIKDFTDAFIGCLLNYKLNQGFSEK